MVFMDYALLISTAALCVWAIGHLWINSFFDRKEELIKHHLDINPED